MQDQRNERYGNKRIKEEENVKQKERPAEGLNKRRKKETKYEIKRLDKRALAWPCEDDDCAQHSSSSSFSKYYFSFD